MHTRSPSQTEPNHLLTLGEAGASRNVAQDTEVGSVVGVFWSRKTNTPRESMSARVVECGLIHRASPVWLTHFASYLLSHPLKGATLGRDGGQPAHRCELGCGAILDTARYRLVQLGG